MKSLSNKFLLTNLIAIGLMFIMNKFWDELGLKDSYYAIIFIFIYGISSAGIVAGYLERKTGNKKANIGIIGNSILTLIIIIGVLYVAVYYTE